MRDASLEDRTRAVMARMERLPSPSVVAVRLFQATQSSDTAVRDIVDIVSQDPAIAARVVSLCRRCHRGLAVEVDSIERAVVLLGFDEIRAAALSVELAGLLNEQGADELGARLRRRAVVVASLSRLAADRLPALDSVEPSTAFLAGLLHDLGHLALHAAIPEALDRIAESASLGDTDFDAALRRLVGIDGPIAGERIAARWGLPTMFRRTIGPGGHDGAFLKGDGLALERLVVLADLVVRRHGIGSIGRRPSEGAARSVESALGLEPDALDALLPEAVELASSTAELLGLDREPSEALLVRTLAEANADLDRMRRRLAASVPVDRSEGGGEIAAFLAGVDASDGAAAVVEAILDQVRRLHPTTRAAVGWRQEGAWWIDDVAEPVSGDILDRLRDVLSTSIGEPRFHGGPHDEVVVATRPAVPMSPDLVAVWRATLRAAVGRESAERHRAEREGLRADEAERIRREAAGAADASVAEIAAGVAHEMNNPLTVISGRAQLLRGRSGDPLVEDAIAEILSAGRTLAGIVSGLHRHAVASTLDRSRIDGAAFLSRAAAEAQRGVRRLGPIEVVDEAGAVPLDLDVRRMVEVVVEACRNAREADERARIRIRTSSDIVDGRWSLLVEDDGPGFGREALDHAFEPFFSLKPAGRRAGLGLAIVRRVVEAHGGLAVVRNRSEGGGCLVVSLPIRSEETDRRAA